MGSPPRFAALARLRRWLDQRSPAVLLSAGAAAVAGIGVVDYATGPEWSWLVFYLAPIAAVTWLGGKARGSAVAALSAVVWVLADLIAGHPESPWTIRLWNGFVGTAFFITVPLVLAALRDALLREQSLARTDALTGTANTRAFIELADLEMRRARRYATPFALAYLDIDEFKQVNDALGHSAGNAMLQTVAAALSRGVRETDHVARMGGDEFALLVTDANEVETRRVVQRVLAEVALAMKGARYTASFSMGVAMFLAPPATVDELIARADELMYEVKRSGKNAVRYRVFAEQSAAS
jgi:diguanylate cyclase (GGDEF)-like protein